MSRARRLVRTLMISTVLLALVALTTQCSAEPLPRTVHPSSTKTPEQSSRPEDVEAAVVHRWGPWLQATSSTMTADPTRRRGSHTTRWVTTGKACASQPKSKCKLGARHHPWDGRRHNRWAGSQVRPPAVRTLGNPDAHRRTRRALPCRSQPLARLGQLAMRRRSQLRGADQRPHQREFLPPLLLRQPSNQFPYSARPDPMA